MNIILFSDLHFHPHEVMSFQEGGINSRLNDSINVFKRIKDYAITNNITKILFLGDFFHTRSKIDINVYNMAYDIFEEFHEAGLEIYLLAGNHDLYYRNTAKVTSLRPLSKFATVINKPTFVHIEGTDFAMFPYYEKSKDLADAINQLDYRDKSNLTFLLHTEFKGARRNALSSPIKTGIDESIFPGNTYRVYMGHYHMAQRMNQNIMYLGSPIQVSMREITEQKFFYVMDTVTTTLMPIPAESPSFTIISYPSKKVLRYWNDKATVEEAINGNYVEVRAFETIKKNTYFYKMLKKARNYIVTNKIDEQEVNRSVDDVDLNIDDLNPLIDKYVDDHPFEKGTSQVLLSAKNKIMELS